MRRYLPSWLRLKIKLALALFALAGADSIVSDDQIAARERIMVHKQGGWLLRYAVRLSRLQRKSA